MNEATRRRLIAINREFYDNSAQDFDATRQRAWLGWERMLSALDGPVASVLDLGCGNGRFARFLARRQTAAFRYCGVDSSGGLLAVARRRLAGESGIQAELIERDLGELPRRRAQLVVLFGALHHIPGFAARRELLARAADLVLPGGWLAFTAWRFYEEERFRRRVVAWEGGLEPEPGDYLLDWRRGERGLRYCHHIDDAEHQSLLDAAGLELVADYRADGASGRLNRYSVLRRERGERE